ncbi:Protein OS-9 [Mortierella alpina]|uniref:Protein OS-9 homolog n=1 Tax=Mortierella alpina TaxID=64518 RepID=A0A9P6M3N6_MORAP|nr:Protein OS-9 [Mortierella alpina]
MHAAVVACTSISLAALPALVASHSVGFVYNDLLAHPQYHVRYLKELVPISSVSTEALHRRNVHHRKSLTSAETQHSKDHQRVFSSPASSMIMPDVRGQRWICTIPPKQVQHVKTPPKKTPQEMEEQNRMSVKKGLELLDHLTGHCLRTTHDYWTYEYCHKKHIRQFHADIQNGQLVPASAASTHTLALYQPPPAEIQGHPDNEGSLQQRDSSSSSSSSSSTTQAGTVTELAVSNDQKYLVQQWGQGEICDLTGAPRKVQVRFQCANVDDRIQHVSEPSTCNYIMLIYSPSLCKEVAFENIPAPEVNNIDCRRIVADELYYASIAPPESIDSGAQANIAQHQQHGEQKAQPQKQESDDQALPLGAKKNKAPSDHLGKSDQDSKQLDQMAILVGNYIDSLKALMSDSQRAGFQNLQDMIDSKLEQLQRSEDEQRAQNLDMESILGLLLGTPEGEDALSKRSEDRDQEGTFEGGAKVKNGPASDVKDKRRAANADGARDEQLLLTSTLAALLETLQSANVAETRHQGLGKEDEQDRQEKKRL